MPKCIMAVVGPDSIQNLHENITMIRMQTLCIGIVFFTICSCSNSQQTGTLLKPGEFSTTISSLPNEVILDVRTPGEFQGGHIKEAVNIDFNDPTFDQQIAKLDKSTPYMVYCLSGGRSAAAANTMRNAGFTKVYELDGGMIAWRSANLPETTDQPKPMETGMNQQEFLKSLEGNTPVLVDFYAEWCKPCKQMQPFLEKMEKEMAGKVIIKRIDADQNPSLLQSMGIEGIPYLILHDGTKVVWNHMGFIDETTLRKEISNVLKF
ncbi:MAG: redoxin domain-containing protein [Ignavibacteria bacterium]|nr:redoxin domain-containing protein [Ignavibacteria bacterium]